MTNLTQCKIHTIILKQLKNIQPEQITESSELIGDLGADSLDMTLMMFDVEDVFGVAIPESDLDAIKTVADVVKVVERLQGSGGE